MQLRKTALSLAAYTQDFEANVARICVCYKVLDRSCFRGYIKRTAQKGGATLCGDVVCAVNVISSFQKATRPTTKAQYADWLSIRRLSQQSVIGQATLSLREFVGYLMKVAQFGRNM